MKRIYRIINSDGVKVCDRATKRECVDMLKDHVTEPPKRGWDAGPYDILRIETTHVRRFYPCSTDTKGKER